MITRTLYCDTSAVVKLVVREAGSPVVADLWDSPKTRLVSSELLITELKRATRRQAAPVAQVVRQVLSGIHLVAVSRHILEAAADIDPTVIRSLDAIHLATALELGTDLTAVVTFDARMADAARALGLAVIPRSGSTPPD